MGSQVCDLLIDNAVVRETSSAGDVGVPSSINPLNPHMVAFLKSWLVYLRGPGPTSLAVNTRKKGQWSKVSVAAPEM